MTDCGNCGLYMEKEKNMQNICDPCSRLVQGDPQIHLSPVSREDLELILAWRSHPEIYRHFRNQTEPLTWSKHLSWFKSREPSQEDFLIHYGGRRVGVVGINLDNEITIYLGDFSAQRKGIATAVINWLKDRFNTRTPLVAEVSAENESSKHLFERCSFIEADRSNGWVKYIYDS